MHGTELMEGGGGGCGAVLVGAAKIDFNHLNSIFQSPPYYLKKKALMVCSFWGFCFLLYDLPDQK